MKKEKVFWSLVFGFLALCLTYTDATAQKSRINNRTSPQKVEKQDRANEQPDPNKEESRLIDKLWFGGNFILGFSNNSRASQFVVGVSPMVGYKITEDWSVGPRLSLQYSNLRFSNSSGNVDKLNIFTFGGGVFTRYKVFQNFFAHFETGLTTAPYLVQTAGGLDVLQELRNPVYIGVGYSAGGGEFVLLYDLNNPDETRVPIDYRVGFNYNF